MDLHSLQRVGGLRRQGGEGSNGITSNYNNYKSIIANYYRYLYLSRYLICFYPCINISQLPGQNNTPNGISLRLKASFLLISF